MAMCKGCGAHIIWAVTENGKKIPVSGASHEKRLIFTQTVDTREGDHQVKVVDTYLSHFADCPEADQFRK